MSVKENKMGVMPINKLLITMSLPMMISMLVQALYNVVDSIFVAQINEYALRAVSLAFPIQNLMIGVAVGTSVGVNAFLSKTLGEKEYEKANLIARNGVFIEVISYFVFVLVGILVSKPFFASQTDIPEVQEYGVTYLTLCCVMSLGVFMQVVFERLLQSTGKTFYTMITQGVGAIINLHHDYPGGGGDYQFDSRPYLDFRIFRHTKAGRCGCGIGYGNRSDDCRNSGDCFKCKV